VAGAFTGGGAQIESRKTELHYQLAETLSATRGRHLLQAGFQVPDWSRRRFDDTSGFGGTFSFADLASYEAGRPYSYVQQTGNGHVVWLEKVLGAYAKDDWQFGPHRTISVGVRYDWSNYFPDNNNVAPRASFAVAPGGSGKTTIRGGAGVFYDKVGPTPVIDVLHFRPGGLQRVVLTNPSYPDPFANGGGFGVAPPSIVRFAPGIAVPWTVQYSAGLERQVGKATTASITYYGSDSRRFRSLDLNAPPPPAYAARPNPAFGVIRQIDASARQRSDALQFVLRGKVTRWFNGQMQYTLSRTMNDSGSGFSWFPANDYDLSGEWARANFDRRHRLLLLETMSPGRQWNLGVALTLESGLPYTETVPGDPFNNGRGGARPDGVGRNGLQGAADAELDLRLSRALALGGASGPKLTLGLDAFNVLNRANYVQYVGVITSPLFGHPVTAQAPRELQLSLGLKF
jgi:hypothetical protein